MNTGPRLRRGGTAEDFHGAKTDDGLKTALAADQRLRPHRTASRIEQQAPDDALAFEAEGEGLEKMSETAMVPERRPKPGKKAEEDFGPGRHDGALSPAI
jgi:hypothetical protein